MKRATPPEDFSDLERELAALEPPELAATQRARLLAIPERTEQPRLWLPTPRLKRAALTVWAAAAAIGLFFGGGGVFDTEDSSPEPTPVVSSDTDTAGDTDAALDLLAELALPDLEDAP